MTPEQLIVSGKGLIIGIASIAACILAGAACYKLAISGLDKVSPKDAAEIAGYLGIAVYTLK